ncbi:conserved hypothetical protein, partial [Leishmania infantum JPCM5]
PRLSA